ncbi:MAG: glycosyltransferase [Proteobacteria bacterium]|nr:glycosyltransferase [Pseudomonadota bacterium]
MRLIYNTWPGAFLAPGGGEVQLLESKKALTGRGYQVELFNQWSPSSADVFHQFSVDIGSLTILNHYKNRSAIVLSPILWPVDALPQETRDAFGKVLNTADVLCTNSDLESDRISTFFGISRDKFFKTRNAVSEPFFNLNCQADLGLNLPEEFVLSVANVDQRKNYHTLRYACRNLKYPLVTVGAIKDKEYFESLSAIGGEWIHLGAIHDPEVLKWLYQRAKVFALVSFFETPGIAALEAISQTAPVVVTSSGSTHEYFGGYARYCDPHNFDDVVDQIKFFWTNNQRNYAGRDYILQNYTWVQCADDLELAYRQAIVLYEERISV